MRTNRGTRKKLLPCQLVDPQRGSFTPSGQVGWLGRASRTTEDPKPKAARHGR